MLKAKCLILNKSNIDSFKKVATEIVKISLGPVNSFFLTDSGDLYGSGLNNYNQL